MDRDDLRRGLAHGHRPGGVGPVAVHEATEVEDHCVPVLDDPLPRLVVRVGAVRAGAHHGEVDLLVAEPAQQAGEVGGDLGLAAAGKRHTDDLGVGGVSGCPRGFQPRQLAAVLNRTHHGEAVGQGPVCRAWQLALEAQQVQGPGGVRDAVRPSRAQQGGGHLVGVRAIGPVHQCHRLHALGRLHVGTFEHGDEESGRLVGSEHKHRQPLSDRGRAVPGQPHQVRPWSHHHPGQPNSRGAVHHPLHPLAVVLAGEGWRNWFLSSGHGMSPRQARPEKARNDSSGGASPGEGEAALGAPPLASGPGDIGHASIGGRLHDRDGLFHWLRERGHDPGRLHRASQWSLGSDVPVDLRGECQHVSRQHPAARDQ